MPLRSDIRYRLEYAGLRLFCGIVKNLPAAVSIPAGRTLGRLSGFLLRERMELARSNLRRAFGESKTPEEQRDLISNLLSLLGEALVESIICTGEDLSGNVAVEGMEHIEKALRMNRGLLLLGPHFGLWELAGFIFGARLQNAATVFKPMKNPYVNEYLLQARRESGLGLIPSKNALRLVLQYLRKGSLVVILFDQNAGKGGIPATFFGTTASTYAAPAVFALKTGCPVVPAYMIKEAGFRKHRLVIHEPFPLIATGDKQKDILVNTQQYNDFLESLVRQHPEQWFGWLHRRWKLPRSFSGAAAEMPGE
jgi:KDO2-lipid IV(A) lauroyltransferase